MPVRKKARQTPAKPKKPSAPTGVSQSPPQRDALAELSAAVHPIVGVGASAGGVQPLTELLSHIPERPGMALVLLLHSEKHHSVLVEVLARSSKNPVQFVTQNTPIERDQVYVVPPGLSVRVEHGRLHIDERGGGGASMPIDVLFGTLAEDQGGRAIGVILSGSASDGALGLKAIKAEGGITFAQDESAQFQSMPRAAIAAGAIDFVLGPEEIARELVRIARHTYVTDPAAGRLSEKEMADVFALLQGTHDVDFTHYKPSTIERRIRRRMAIHRVERLADYVRLLRENKTEIEHLYGDLLIRVTSFFRDPDVFDTLKKDVLLRLMRERPQETPVRVWVPGCATGEEVYSLAIALLETAQGLGFNCPIQIFGTDISDGAIERARAGIYPENIAADVSPERLRRFFSKVENGYRVAKSVRNCCVFARQNLTTDPPFSRLDLISCRNVMIYLGADLQRKVMVIFNYALQPNGYLLLGSSETIGSFGDLFSVVDRRHKIYQKKSALTRLPVEFEAASPRARARVLRKEEEAAKPANVFREADRVLLSRFSPPGVLINDDLEILQFRGRTSNYLEPAPGAASFDLLKMAREGLLSELRSALHSARGKEEPVRREGLRLKSDGTTVQVNLEIVPFITPTRERYFLVLFEEAGAVVEEKAAGKKKRSDAATAADERQSEWLKRELESTREYLQSIIEEQEAMNEELRSANEEIQSSNKELQSTNEELETAKEELQSSNEELTTLNEELENRASELAEANNDLVNLLASIDLPIVMLDSGLRIRRFNPGAQRVLNLIPTDVGRPMSDLKMTLVIEDLEKLITAVVDNLEVRELEVQDRSGHWYMLRVRPYKTNENRIEGAVLVLIDIDQLRKRKGRSA